MVPCRNALVRAGSEAWSQVRTVLPVLPVILEQSRSCRALSRSAIRDEVEKILIGRLELTLFHALSDSSRHMPEHHQPGHGKQPHRQERHVNVPARVKTAPGCQGEQE